MSQNASSYKPRGVIVVTGGKGGTGKTVIAVNLAASLVKAGYRVLIVDIDVENPCTYTLLSAELEVVKEVKAFKPVIDETKCLLCGACVEKCPAHALVLVPGSKVMFFRTLCEGCAACLYSCPSGAVGRGEEVVGWVKAGKAGGTSLVVGELKPGDRRYHEVMEETLEYARRVWSSYDVVVVDTPPGAGKGVASALRLADLIIMVTEPTRLGLADLSRLHKLAREVGRREIVVVNKYDLPGGVVDEVEKFAEREGLMLAKIRYDPLLVRSYVEGKLVVEEHPGSPSARDIGVLTRLTVALL